MSSSSSSSINSIRSIEEDALEEIFEWASSGTTTFCLRKFDTSGKFDAYGGVPRVLDFLKDTIDMDDEICVGAVRMQCIAEAAYVLMQVCYRKEGGGTFQIAKTNAMAVVNYHNHDHDGIQTVLLASDEYAGGNDPFELKAMLAIWSVLENIASFTGVLGTTDVIYSGIDILSQLSSVDDPIACKAMRRVFGALGSIAFEDCVTKNDFKEKDIVTCLEVFKHKHDDGSSSTWKCGNNEALTEAALRFFCICHKKDIFDHYDSYYESLLPLCAMGLKEFPANRDIRQYSINLIDTALCSEVNDNDNKTTIKDSGALKNLLTLLESDNTNEAVKKKVYNLVGKIIFA